MCTLPLAACNTTRIVGVDPQVVKDARKGAATLRSEARDARTVARDISTRNVAAELPRAAAEEVKASDLERRAGVVDELKDKILFTQGEYFFTIEPLVAVHSGLEATAIPSIGVNWRPNWATLGKTWFEHSALSFQLVLGGVLNPQDEDSETAALGGGLRQPIGKSGAISLGWIVWNEEGSSESGLYVGVSLGESGTEPPSD